MDQLSDDINELRLNSQGVPSGPTPDIRNFDKPFRGLPAELRTVIWRHVLQIEIAIDVPALCREEPGCLSPWPINPYALLQVNKQVHNEATAELCGVSIVFNYIKPGGPRARWTPYSPRIWHKRDQEHALQTGISTNTTISSSSSSPPTVSIAYPSMTSLERKAALCHLSIALQIIDHWNLDTESLHMHVDSSHGKGLCEGDLQFLIWFIHVHISSLGCHKGQKPLHMYNRILKSWGKKKSGSLLQASSLEYTIWQTVRRPDQARSLKLMEMSDDRHRFDFKQLKQGRASETWIAVDEDHYECRVMLPSQH